MFERRKDVRQEANVPVKCWVMDRGYAPILTECVPASCLNVSSGGMELEWPSWWKCKGCHYNGGQKNVCTRQECPFGETNNFLMSETFLRIYVDEKKAEQFAKVVWIKPSSDKNCRIGISFAAT